MKACFMGLGYIGLPTAIIAAKHGVQVTGVDINPKVVELTNQGKLHIIEPMYQFMIIFTHFEILIHFGQSRRFQQTLRPFHCVCRSSGGQSSVRRREE